ncbi:hypothetical protein NW765_005966 [Fusarium oxysporum]|nr:hypothetical protein NW765_005966 [Fusarium oxysporum]KAJ4282480.1 hypothetical protein NW764_003488 [Fusarium oxysporum]
MDPNNGKDSSNSRRSSTRRSRSLRLSTGSGANDDYDLSAMMVADGFRPSDNATSSSSINPTSNSNTQPESSLSSTESFSQQSASTKSSQAPLVSGSDEIAPAIRNRPSSISKPHRNHDSLALRNDGTSTADRSHIRNNHSLSSDSPVIRAESPYTGPSGPSHPYQMYPQRTMSVATTSTTANAVIPEDRSYGGTQAPTHPYTLYTQNTTSGESSAPSIPVGFNGLGGTYQRQLGPDGEEAGDLVGPLGHMEELPPYTRYPDNAYVPKPATQTPVSPVSPVSEPASPTREIPGAGGIGMATRDPEFSSTDDDLALPRTRPSVRSHASEASHHDINTAAAETSEKPTVNKWQRRAKKKLWGIVPYWAICLLLVGLILMGIIMGAVIGTMLTKNHNNNPDGPPDPNDKYSYQPPTTTTYDPEIITTIPTDLPPMAVGRFALPNIDPSPQNSNACFNDSQQSSAWSCDIVIPMWSIQIDKGTRSKSKPCYNLTLKAIPDKDTPFPWGAQPPSIPQPTPMVLVNDTLELARGPAWWLRTKYNKTVIVSEKKFGAALSKRGWDGDDEYEDYNSFHRFKNKAPPNAKKGDKPWICTWPDTVIEFFIYPGENSSTYHPPSATTTGSEGATATYSTYSSTSTADWSSWKQPVPVFPHVYKMVERRFLWGEESVATCTQYEIIGDGDEKRPVEKDGKKVVIVIVEQENEDVDNLDLTFTKRSELETKKALRQLLKRTNPSLTDCGCSWTSL